MIIDGLEFTMEIDLVKQKIVEEIKGKKIVSPYSNFHRDDSFRSMHTAIITEDDKHVCTYKEGKMVMKAIEEIRNFSE